MTDDDQLRAAIEAWLALNDAGTPSQRRAAGRALVEALQAVVLMGLHTMRVFGSEADDLQQEMLLALLDPQRHARYLERSLANTSPRAYLLRYAKSRVKDHWKYERPRKALALDTGTGEDDKPPVQIAAPGPAPDAGVLGGEVHTAIGRALVGLTVGRTLAFLVGDGVYVATSVVSEQVRRVARPRKRREQELGGSLRRAWLERRPLTDVLAYHGPGAADEHTQEAALARLANTYQRSLSRAREDLRRALSEEELA